MPFQKPAGKRLLWKTRWRNKETTIPTGPTSLLMMNNNEPLSSFKRQGTTSANY